MADAETVGPTRPVLEPLHLALHVARSLSPWYHKIPDIDVVGKLDAVKVYLAFCVLLRLSNNSSFSDIFHNGCALSLLVVCW